MTSSAITGEPTVPVLYLDIDGTVRKGKDELGHFVNTADDVEVFPEVPELLSQYRQIGYRIVGVSNQGGIALGHMSIHVCAQAMVETQKQCHFGFDKLAWCSHHPDASDPEMARCWCRKPKIGLIIETALAMSNHYKEIYPPHMGLFVGDMESDAECAENADLDFMYATKWREGLHLREVQKNSS